MPSSDDRSQARRLTVAVNDVRVTYRTPSSKAEDLAGKPAPLRLAMNAFGQKPMIDVHALKGVSFAAYGGESIGILGRNGSGKSTLLRILAGLETPNAGWVRATATPVLLGVNAALVPDLPGERNIVLGCLAMGMTLEEAQAQIAPVTELAGIGDAIYRPMKTYSSGMASRLRFAIAASADPDILCIDEALGTGDQAFKERSERTMRALLDRAGTVFIVSHAAKTIEALCTRAIWLMDGELIGDGPGAEIAHDYRWWSWNIAKEEFGVAADVLAKAKEKWKPRTPAFPEDAPMAVSSRHGREAVRA